VSRLLARIAPALAAAALAFAAALGLATCVDATFEDGQFRCEPGTKDACPAGQTCAADGLCRAPGGAGGDAGAGGSSSGAGGGACAGVDEPCSTALGCCEGKGVACYELEGCCRACSQNGAKCPNDAFCCSGRCKDGHCAACVPVGAACPEEGCCPGAGCVTVVVMSQETLLCAPDMACANDADAARLAGRDMWAISRACIAECATSVEPSCAPKCVAAQAGCLSHACAHAHVRWLNCMALQCPPMNAPLCDLRSGKGCAQCCAMRCDFDKELGYGGCAKLP
jgi:hypothetical protein